MSLYLGIDGGGTKTLAAVAEGDCVLGAGAAGGSNLVRTPLEQVRASLHAAISEACRSAGITTSQIDSTCVGAAGSARPEIRAQVESIVRELVPARLEIVGDMEIAHAAAFSDSPGIVVISGTGSIAYARNPQGETARAGGWGRVTSDEGSGYWIGRRAVSVALRAGDSGQDGILMTRIQLAWRLDTREEVGLFANRTPVPDFSALFPEVLAAASEGDVAARDVLAAAGRELAQLAMILIGRLWRQGGPVKVAMTGGVFTQSAVVRESFEESVRREHADAEVFLNTVEPVLGAIYLARESARQAKLVTDTLAKGK